MKLLLVHLFMLFQIISIAQIDTTKGINFQAIARNADGSIVPSKDISIRLSIREGSASGTIEYQEIKTTKTNVVGLFSVVFGSKENSNITVIGDYNNINWHSGNKYLQVEIDPFNSINFILLGIQKINYVPFALVANSVDWVNVKGLNTALDKKLNIQDTAYMLKPYLKSGASIVASKLENAKKINGVDFDGTADIIVPASSATNTFIATKESLDNKSVNITTDASSDIKYPSVKAVKTYVDGITVAGAPDADASTKGLIKLSGDLSGTANAPTVSKINGTALSGLTTGILKNTTSTGVPSIAVAGTDYVVPNTAITNLSGTNTGDETTTTIKTKLNISTLSGTNTGDQTIQLTGDLTGSGTGTFTTTLSNSGVTANTYGSASAIPVLTIDAKGRVTNATTNSFQVNAGSLTGTTLHSAVINSSLSSVGTITNGTWSSTAIDIAHGGTGTSTLSGILLGTNGSGLTTVSTAAYGSWYDDQTQVATVANTAYPMYFRVQDFSQGVSIVNNSKITFTKTGKYNIQFSAQLDRSSGTSTEYVSIWLRKNGTDVPASCTDLTIQGGTLVAATVAAWNFFQSVTANDYIEIMWSSTSTTIQIQKSDSRSAPVRPLIPSVILTVQQVY